MMLISDINSLDYKIFRHAKFFSAFKYNIFMNVLWDIVNNRLSLKIRHKRILFEELKDKDIINRPYYKYGPKRKFESEEQAFEYFSDIWVN